MKSKLFLAVISMVVAGAIGCGAPQPPLPCTQTASDWRQQVAQDRGILLEYCDDLGMVCDESVTLADECPTFLADLEEYFIEVILPVVAEKLPDLPWYIDPEKIIGLLFLKLQGVCGEADVLDQFGTCQPLGQEGDPCLADSECLEGLLCVSEVCTASPPI
ncbi:MAG: Dickkopf N-terminal cysteine-rich domain-containing protein [bacterium]